jgi:hypothetical protein
MREKFLIVFTLVWLAAVPSLAAVIDGGAWAELYSFDNKFPQTQSHLRTLEGLRLGIRDAYIPGLSIFARGRVASDLSHKFSTDPDLRVFGAYLEYTTPTRWLTARAGRQFVFAGLGGITMDGAKIDLLHKSGIGLTGYVGSTPGPTFFDLDEINSWKKSNAFGGRLKYSGLHHWLMGASFQQRNFNDNLDSRLGGLDVTYSDRMCSIFGRGDYDFFFKKLQLIDIRPTIRTPMGHYLGLEYMYHRPSLPLHSMFSVFDSRPYHQARVSPTIKIMPDLFGIGSFVYTRFKNDNNYRFSIGASYQGQSAGFIFSDGYGGRQVGGFGYLTYNLTKMFELYLHGDIFDYKVDKDEDAYTHSLATALGTNITIVKNFQARAEVQLLSNRDYKYDSRFYLRLEYSLRKIVSESIGGDGQ